MLTPAIRRMHVRLLATGKHVRADEGNVATASREIET